VFDEGPEQLGSALNGAGRLTGRGSERAQVKEGAIGQRVGLQIGPDVFNGIEFGSVGGKKLGPDAGTGLDEALHLAGAVSLKPIPNQNDRRIDMTLKLTEESDRQVGIRVLVGKQPEVELHAIPTGWNTQCADDGHLCVGPGALRQTRRFPAPIPGPAQQRSHQSSTLVEEHQGGLQSRGFFLMRPQSCLIQRWMASSSRSTARRWGF